MKEVCLAVARFRNDKKEAISKNFVNLAEGISAKGYPVSTYTPTRFETLHPIRQNYQGAASCYSSLSESVQNLYRICREVNKRQKRYSVINFHIATPIELFFLFLFLDRRTRNRTVVSIWQSYLTLNEFRDNFSYFSRNFIKYLHIILLNSFITAPLYILFLIRFGRIIVHSTYLREQLSSLSDQEIAFVQNGVLPENTPIPKIVRREKFVLLYIGHAKASKGVDKLMKLISILRQRGNLNFILVLSLSGFGEEQSIRQLISEYKIEDKVLFKRDIDVIQEMASANLCILPLRTCVGTSLTPNVIIEALSIGLPLAVPYYPELNELIQFGFNAIELNLSDPESCAEGIEAASSQIGLLRSISENQRKQFRNRFTLERFIDGYIQELQSI